MEILVPFRAPLSPSLLPGSCTCTYKGRQGYVSFTLDKKDNMNASCIWYAYKTFWWQCQFMHPESSDGQQFPRAHLVRASMWHIVVPKNDAKCIPKSLQPVHGSPTGPHLPTPCSTIGFCFQKKQQDEYWCYSTLLERQNSCNPFLKSTTVMKRIYINLQRKRRRKLENPKKKEEHKGKRQKMENPPKERRKKAETKTKRNLRAENSRVSKDSTTDWKQQNCF